MATRMAQVPLQNCEICENKVGRRYCIDCEQYFCKTCEDFHLKSKSCRDHVFQDLGQINPEEKKVKCKEHNENMTYYCTTCSMLVCKICLPNKHTKHDFTLTSEAALKYKTDLEPHIEQMKTVVRSIGQQRTTLEGKTNQFINSNERIVKAIKQKGSELKDIIDKIVYGKVANVTTEEEVNLQKKKEEERILKNAQERAEMVLLKVTNAVENQGDTMLLNSHQSLQQAMQSMSDIAKSDLEFPTLIFEDGSLDENTLTEMIGSVMISKTEGARIQVQRHIPPQTYPNKVLVIQINSKTTHVELRTFLKTRTNLDVEEVYFGGDDSGKAVVTFSDAIDIEDLQTACTKKALDGSYLTVHPVVVTNCIVVRDFSERTTESGLEYYFDNKRKSGVEGVTDVQMNKNGDYCVIYFDNAEDVLLACKRSHTIDNCTLNVKVFYDCLGVPADNEGPTFKPLPPLDITDIYRYKVNYLKGSAQYKKALERQLELSHAKITWPSSMSDSKIVIECTLTKETEDCRKLAKSWEDDIKRQLSTHVDALVTEKHFILQEAAWSGVMQKLREINISDPEDVSVSVEKPPTCEIIVVGRKKAVKEVSDNIKQFINEVSEDLDREKKLVTEKVPLKHYQLLYLAFSDFIDKIRQNFNKMEISINTREGVIIFHGLSGNVNYAKLHMFELVQDLASVNVGKKSPGYIKFLNRKDVKTLVGEEIKSQGFIAVWDIQKNIITMYAVSDEEAVAAYLVLKDCVIETEIPLETPQKPLLGTNKWSQYVQSINEEYQSKSVIIEINTDSHQGEITVYCTSRKETGLLREKIQDFFYHNTETQIRIDFRSMHTK